MSGKGKKTMIVAGVMSGTSADGIDVVLSRISGAPPRVAARLLKHTTVKFPANVRAEILRVAAQHAEDRAGQALELGVLVGRHLECAEFEGDGVEVNAAHALPQLVGVANLLQRIGPLHPIHGWCAQRLVEIIV